MALLPERVPGFVVAEGQAVGRSLPSLDAREIVGPWRDAVGGKGPFFVRLAADDPSLVAHVQRLSRVGELWVEAPLRSVDDALDLLVAGAARLVVPTADRDAEMAEAVGPSAILDWDGRTPWPDVEAAALEHGVPVLARQEPPAGAACDVFLLAEGPEGPALARVASAPAHKDAEGDGDGAAE